ncbi:MAG: sodium:solute symporter [Marinilabiliales bacterium]|nr:MAG: sodium:solute symporter [Marinilabiliales bacterium]
MLVKLIVISVYALMIIIIGIVGMRKTKSFNDFFLGGGNVGPWMTAFSYGTAYFSAVLFIGFAGKIGWGFGYSGMWIALFNALVGVLLVWGVFGWRIKKMSTEYGVSTMSEFLEKRYNSKNFKLMASIVIFIFMIPYSAAVFMGLSYLFTSSFGIDYWVALVFMGGFTATYIILGGYKSMAMIDMIFGIIMTVGVVVLFFSTIDKGGGIANISDSLAAINDKLVAPVGPPGIWPLLSLVFLTSVAPFAMPQLVQKFYAIKDKRSVKIGMFASTFFAMLIGGVAYFMGSTTRVLITPEANPNSFDAGKPLFDRLMPELLTNVIPDSLSVLILLLILSASMSTLAALVLISSSSFTKDFYAGYIKKDMSDKGLTRMMRIMSGVFVFLAVILAYVELDVIVEILGISWGAIGSFFLGPFVWGLFSKKVNRLGGLSAAILGLAVCLTLYFIGLNVDIQPRPWYFSSPGAGTIGMLVSLVVNPVFSLFGKKA